MEVERSIDVGEWDHLNRISSQGSVFCDSRLLAALGMEPRFWFVHHKGRKLLGAIALFASGEPVRYPSSFMMYQGLLVDPEFESMPPHSRIPAALEAHNALLAALAADGTTAPLSLHHTITDIRAFLWYRDAESDNRAFRVVPRYTAVIKVDETLFQGDRWLSSIRRNRRIDHSKAANAGISIESFSDADTLYQLYLKTFQRQGDVPPAETEARVHCLAKFILATGMGLMLLARDPDGSPLGAVLFLRHGDVAYYIIGANDPKGRPVGAATFVMVEALRRLAAQGVRSIDMCGANSPQRSDFKISFNAEPRLFFDVVWNRQEKGA